jgi:hypothetical protein
MSRKLILLSTLFLLLGTTAAQAATTIVAPGIGALKAAVDAAADGDILLLQNGNYDLNDNIDVDVGITIRPQDNTQQPVIVLNNRTITLSHSIGTTTLQKLTFIGNGFVSTTSSSKKLNILENTFTDVRLSLGHAAAPCYVIGNSSQRSGAATSGYIVSLGAACYTAGNTFLGTRSFTARSGYFIGNKVSASHGNSNGIGIFAAYAIGNEFIRNLDTNPPIGLNNDYSVATFNAPQQTGLTGKWPHIANNIFRVIGSLGSAPGSAIKTMMAVNLSTSSQLQNNVIDYGQFLWPTQSEQGMIHVNSNSTIQGNIVINGSNNSMPAIAFVNDTERTQSNVSHNDCHNNASDCGNTDGNINLDPDFVDSIDYVLSSGSSPAIDAGPTNEHLNDLDGSRNDMGVHGGSSPITQYKDQLDPAVTAPYVYPVFQDVQTLSGAQVEVTAIGVARFK